MGLLWKRLEDLGRGGRYQDDPPPVNYLQEHATRGIARGDQVGQVAKCEHALEDAERASASRGAQRHVELQRHSAAERVEVRVALEEALLHSPTKPWLIALQHRRRSARADYHQSMTLREEHL